ncbi:sugar ABC transporter ATP-binding protein [Paracoccaceae bacterium]|nr:sugar ABC transporter ATP-binding protein [Paracoccaceae bacterium]
MSDIACEISDLKKSFGPNQVLRGISMKLPSGQVSVLMGANGAGKSTLVKVLCGVQKSDSGDVKLFGSPFKPKSPIEAYKYGVITVHQSINDGVIPDLDVTSNLLLDSLAQPGKQFLLKRSEMKARATEIAKSIGFKGDLDTVVARLGIADRQMIAIARAVACNPKLLILDEPTSSLSAIEAKRLFEVIEKLKREGVAILYISHRMSDIRAIADRILAMRDGRISGEFEGEDLDYEGAVTAMLGKKMSDFNVDISEVSSPVLQLCDLRLSKDSKPLDITVSRGEVLVITGLLGSGKSLLSSILFGLEKPAYGQILLEGLNFEPNSPANAIASGVHMSPKDRANNAIVGDFDIEANLTLPFTKFFSNFGFIDKKRQRVDCSDMIDTMGIVCQGGKDSIGTLSGGNQQKVIVGRWLLKTCKLLILDEPFQGVDIKARRDIGTHIRATSNNRATLVFVSEIDEAVEIADRIIVLHEKAVVGEHVNKNIDLPELLSQVSGNSNTLKQAESLQ